jgi:hypothetical protein
MGSEEMMKKKPQNPEEEKMNGWLYGWKDIADFCGCTVETARKKVMNHGLPVYRDPDKKPIALRLELNDWLKKCKKY